MCIPARRVFGLLWLLFATTGISVVNVRAEEPAVQLISEHPGHVFVEGEPLEIGLRVRGPSSRMAVEIKIVDTNSAWTSERSFTIPRLERGRVETQAIPLPLPGRGIFKVRVEARAGLKSHRLETTVALVFAPPPPEKDSPWGVFYVPPAWFDPQNPKGAELAAESLKRLGASWAKLGFWEHAFGEVTIDTAPARRAVRTDTRLWQSYARALRDRGLHVAGMLQQVPRALSSQPQSEGTAGDGGPLYARVKPADYEVWDKWVEQTAREFADTIDFWEIWNEPDNQQVYFAGTQEEFFELVQHTARALRRGNANAQIAAPGLTTGGAALGWGTRLLQLGMAKEIDVFTVHYTARDPHLLAQWSELLRRSEAELPIWNTEEREIVPLFDRAHGVPRTFKFLHVAFGYEESEPLVNRDYTLRPAGLAYSVAVHCLGSARFDQRIPVRGGVVWLFRKGAEQVAVYEREPLAAYLLGDKAKDVPLRIMPLAGQEARVTDLIARVTPLDLAENGRALLHTSGEMLFINGCREIRADAAKLDPATMMIAKAESGHRSASWTVQAARGASGQSVLAVDTDENNAEGHWAELSVDVPQDGRYELVLSASDLAQLAAPRAISGFYWSVDGGAENRIESPLPALPEAATSGLQLHRLGEVRLTSGTHVIRLRLARPRETSGPKWSFRFDALGLKLLPSLL